MNYDKVRCLILDSVEEHYHAVWEIFDVMKNNLNGQSEDEIVDLMAESINYLLTNRLIELYEGYSFNGEQKIVANLIPDKNFIKSHLFDWKETTYKGINYRFAITDSGVEFLSTKCKPEYFKSNF